MPNDCTAFPQPLLDFSAFLSLFTVSLCLSICLHSSAERIFISDSYSHFFPLLSLLVFLHKMYYIPVSSPRSVLCLLLSIISRALLQSADPPGEQMWEPWMLGSRELAVHTSNNFKYTLVQPKHEKAFA